MTLNGAKTSERTFLDPGFTSYDKTVLYTTDDVTGLIRQNASHAGRERDRLAARLRPVRQRDDLGRLGLVDRRVAREPDAADRPRTSSTRTAPSRSSSPTTRGRRAPRARSATTTTTSARPTTRARELPALGHAELRRDRLGDRAHGHRPGRHAARAEPRAHVADRHLPGRARAREPQPRVFVWDTGQQRSGWATVKRQRRARRHADPDPLRREARRQRPGQHHRLRARGPDPDRLLHRQGHRHGDVHAALHLQGLPVRPDQRGRRRARCRTASPRRVDSVQEIREPMAADRRRSAPRATC